MDHRSSIIALLFRKSSSKLTVSPDYSTLAPGLLALIRNPIHLRRKVQVIALPENILAEANQMKVNVIAVDKLFRSPSR